MLFLLVCRLRLRGLVDHPSQVILLLMTCPLPMESVQVNLLLSLLSSLDYLYLFGLFGANNICILLYFFFHFIYLFICLLVYLFIYLYFAECRESVNQSFGTLDISYTNKFEPYCNWIVGHAGIPQAVAVVSIRQMNFSGDGRYIHCFQAFFFVLESSYYIA